MNMQRRLLIKLGVLGTVLVPSAGVMAAASQQSALKRVPVLSDAAQPLYVSGDWLLADTAETSFSGDGHYLYPAWGQPRAYLVTSRFLPGKSVAEFEFRNPANGQLLWQSSLQGETAFAGKIIGRIPVNSTLAELGLAPLMVPALPLYS